MSEKLEPCPFCGGGDVAVGRGCWTAWVQCDDCGAEGPAAEAPEGAGFGSEPDTTETEAIRLWNTRKEPT